MVVYRILFDFRVILGRVYISFLIPEIRNAIFFRACFQVIFLAIFESKFRRLGLPNGGFRIEGIAKKTEIVFNEFRVRFWLFFRCLGGRFSGFLGPENRLENRRIFGDVTNSKPRGRGRRSTSDLGAENN